MCGFHFHAGVEMNIDYSLRALELIEHRGPDMTSHKVIGENNYKVFLGFNRLSITDLSPGAMQPLADLTGRYICLFNGEIYNFKDLRSELLAKGYTFRNNSDTEVLLNSYLEWGNLVINKLEGQYSFVIYDVLDKKVFACRDPLGEKPLYYLIDKTGSIIVSSEKKCISASLGTRLSINTRFVQMNLLGSFPYNCDETIFDNVYQLRAGHFFDYSYNTKKLQIQRYFNYESKINFEKFSENAHFDFNSNFKSLLIESLNERVPTEVPVTLSLSGGIDSSLLASVIMREPKYLGPKLESAITFTFDTNCDVNEISRTREIAKMLNISLIEVKTSSKEIVSMLDKAHLHYEQVIPGLSMLLEWEVMRSANNHNFKVVLSGQGADELFGGYNYILPAFIASGRTIDNFYYAYRNVLDWNHNFYAAGIDPPLSKMELIGKSLKSKYTSSNQRKIGALKKTSLEMILTDDVTKFALPQNLYFGDRNGMAHGIEVRHPYLSSNLINLSENQNYQNLIHRGYQKYALRSYLAELSNLDYSFVPNKLGFEFPKEWFKDQGLKRWILERLTSNTLAKILPDSNNMSSSLVRNFNIEPEKYGASVWPLASAIELINIFS